MTFLSEEAKKQKIAEYEKRIELLREEYRKSPRLSIILRAKALKTAIRILREGK